MGDPDVLGDRRRAAEVGREYRQMQIAAELAAQWRHAKSDEDGAQELLDEGEEIRLAMVERDPSDDKDVIVEIQGGAGGEEAGLWAGDVFKMLSRYATRKG